MDDRLDDLRTMLGDDAGRLALALERLTDGMALVGQHAVYCRVEKGPRRGQAPLDVVAILDALGEAKGLVQEAIQSLREDRKRRP